LQRAVPHQLTARLVIHVITIFTCTVLGMLTQKDLFQQQFYSDVVNCVT